MDANLSRRIVSISDYKHFDRDGWSKDFVLGLVVRDGMIRDARLGDLFEDGVFYDLDGNPFGANQILLIKKDDAVLGKRRLSIKNLFRPTKEQVSALEKVTRLMPWETELKGLLKSIKSSSRI